MKIEEVASAAERYRLAKSTREVEIVDVTVPSGFVFKFEKPSKFRMLFEYGKLPQSATSTAIESWIEQGVIKPGEVDADAIEHVDDMLKIRDRILDLSVDPKLVVGDTANENELSIKDLRDDDTAYLFAWVSAGGETSLMLNTFPEQAKRSTVAGNGRPRRRGKVKRDGGNTG